MGADGPKELLQLLRHVLLLAQHLRTMSADHIGMGHDRAADAALGLHLHLRRLEPEALPQRLLVEPLGLGRGGADELQLVGCLLVLPDLHREGERDAPRLVRVHLGDGPRDLLGTGVEHRTRQLTEPLAERVDAVPGHGGGLPVRVYRHDAVVDGGEVTGLDLVFHE